MKPDYTLRKFPATRIATADVYSAGVLRHHISALLEIDVTDSRMKIRKLRRNGKHISFTGWVIYEISRSIAKFPEAAAYMAGRRKLMLFHDVNISTMVEKEVDGTKVPIALTIEKAHEKGMEDITSEIEQAREKPFSKKDLVLHRSSARYERLYVRLPGIVRRMFWNYLTGHPRIAYRKMGNVMVTSLSMMGKINGWFIHKTVHPISFGIGSVIRKPVVVDNEIKVRDILNLTILMDHDVIDGAPMVRFVKELTRRMEAGTDIL
jgi:pyruvate/2-oxoglutarate dehydrogenase complex dihydrolipoamide acyltransferase (E2) component